MDEATRQALAEISATMGALGHRLDLTEDGLRKVERGLGELRVELDRHRNATVAHTRTTWTGQDR